MQRRTFLTSSVLSALSYSRVMGANDRLGVALIGSGRRGREVMGAFLATGRTDLRCVCDVYDVQRERARSLVKTEAPREYMAHEFALAHPGVDAVLIGTPDHLHLDLTKAALAAGKHVYLEKPASHLFEEGAAMRRMVKLSGKVVQVGTQQRSGAHYKRAKEEFFASGKLGQVVMVRAVWNNFPWQARTIAKSPKPAGLDWVRFLGNTPYFDYDAARYDAWRYYPEYGGGVLADILNHWADVAQWMMDDPRPESAVALGGIYKLRDGRTNPDTVNAIVRYRNWNLTFESSVLSIRDDRPGVLFKGTEGSLFLGRDRYIHMPLKGELSETRVTEDLNVAHVKDFLNAVRDGKQPSAPIDIGLEGLRPCHLSRAAYWSGKQARYDSARDVIVTE